MEPQRVLFASSLCHWQGKKCKNIRHVRSPAIVIRINGNARAGLLSTRTSFASRMKKYRINVIPCPELFPGPLKRQSIMYSEWKRRGHFFSYLLCSSSGFASFVALIALYLDLFFPISALFFYPEDVVPTSCIFRYCNKRFSNLLLRLEIKDWSFTRVLKHFRS